MANRQTDKIIAFGDAVTAVIASGVEPLYPLGTVRQEEGKTYRYVQLDAGATASVAGQLLYRVGGGGSEWIVTKTVANTAPNLAAGVCVAVIAASGHGWMQTAGRYATLKTSGVDDIAKGNLLIETLATTGTVRLQIVATADTAAAVLVQTKLLRFVAQALADDVDGDDTVDAMLMFE